MACAVSHAAAAGMPSCSPTRNRTGRVVRPLLGGAAGNQRGVPGVLRGVMRSVLLMVSICVAMIAVLVIVPAADPVHRIAEQTIKNAGIPHRVAPGPPP